VTGEVLAELNISAGERLQDVAEQQLASLTPFQLLHRGVRCAWRTAENLGLRGGCEVQLVRLPQLKVFRRLSQSRKLASHGYDRGFGAVSSQDPEAFYLCNRSGGRDFWDKDMPGNGMVLADLMAWSAFHSLESCGELDPLLHLKRYSVPPGSSVQCLHPLALGCDGTLYLSGRNGNKHSICSLARGELHVAHESASLAVADAIYHGSSLFVLGEEGEDPCMLQFEISEGRLALERMKILELPMARDDLIRFNTYWNRNTKRFLAADGTGEALWIKTEAGIFVVSIGSLEAHVCFLWHEFTAALPLLEDVVVSRDGVVLDPRTRELYIIIDYTLQIHDTDPDESDASSNDSILTCEVLCLTPVPSRSEKAWEVSFPNLQGSSVCWAPFALDGLGTPYCVLCARWVGPGRIMVVDVAGSLWSMDV
ncbi:unnamed protein product, partial [Symbiodinium sp. CCMP2456]